MSIKDTIKADIANIFTVEDNTPISKQAVYAPPGGVAQVPITVLFTNTPLHGDEQQVYPVVEADTMALGQTSDVITWVSSGTVTIESVDYELVNKPYSQDGFWSILHLRLPIGSDTKI